MGVVACRIRSQLSKVLAPYVPFAIFIHYRINDPAQQVNRMATNHKFYKYNIIKDKTKQNDNAGDGKTTLPKLARSSAASAQNIFV